MKLRYRFRFYPSDRQKRQLAKEFGCSRHAYNWALRLRTDSFQDGKTINYLESSRQWTKHRNDPEFPWLRESSCTPQQQALRHLQTSFSNFFAKRTSYPSFRSKYGPQSAEYTCNSFKWDAGNRNLVISKVGRLRVKWSRRFTSKPTTVTITTDCCGRYHVSLCLDEPAKAKLPATGEQVGVDLGISRLATLSTGERIANPKHTAKYAKKLARAQRVLSRRKRGSHRYARQRRKVARIHSRIANSRTDHLHKITTDLVRRFDVIAIEDLNVRGMSASAKGNKAKPGRNVRQKAGLNRSIRDAGLGLFRTMLEYKVDWYGRELRKADRWFPSSKRCNNCGHIHTKLTLSEREWDCPECHTHHDRDKNASDNILQFAEATPKTTVGQAGSNGRGERVRPGRASARRGCVRRSVNQPVECVLHV